MSDSQSADVHVLNMTLSAKPGLPRTFEDVAGDDPIQTGLINLMKKFEKAEPRQAIANVESVTDWSETLDLINNMSGFADQQNVLLKEQAKCYNETLQELQEELRKVHQRLHDFEIQVQETEAKAEIRVQRVQAEAAAQVQEIRQAGEAQIRAVRAEADSRLRVAEEQVQAATIRALTAEKWLQRIDSAAKNFLRGGQMKATA